ncbi:hypothetical protein KC218_22620, partial [Mycobacterium tuberculosis]|nr:hypothetical protein [Mycobacterium tuberculosis]
VQQSAAAAWRIDRTAAWNFGRRDKHGRGGAAGDAAFRCHHDVIDAPVRVIGALGALAQTQRGVHLADRISETQRGQGGMA